MHFISWSSRVYSNSENSIAKSSRLFKSESQELLHYMMMPFELEFQLWKSPSFCIYVSLPRNVVHMACCCCAPANSLSSFEDQRLSYITWNGSKSRWEMSLWQEVIRCFLLSRETSESWVGKIMKFFFIFFKTLPFSLSLSMYMYTLHRVGKWQK